MTRYCVVYRRLSEMSRKIIDSVFEERNNETNAIETDQNFYFMYGGNVQVGFPKIKIEQMKIDGNPNDLLADIRRNYNGMKFTDEPAIMIVGDQQVTTFPEIIKCLKALFIGQLSKNEDYSKAVAYCATQLVQMCLRSEAVLPILPKPDFNKFQKVVVDEVSKFIQDCFEKEGVGWTTPEEAKLLTVDSSDDVGCIVE